MAKNPASRRVFLKSLAFASAVVVATRRASADEPQLDPKDPAAAALGYVENATEVDLKKYPDYVQGTHCDNCLKLEGKAGNNYRPCDIFPGKVVSVNGWCTGWTAEM